jgi:hypothetical protein
LFYAVIDESMKVTEGGGIPTEGEFIEKVIRPDLYQTTFFN